MFGFGREDKKDDGEGTPTDKDRELQRKLRALLNEYGYNVPEDNVHDEDGRHGQYILTCKRPRADVSAFMAQCTGIFKAETTLALIKDTQVRGALMMAGIDLPDIEGIFGRGKGRDGKKRAERPAMGIDEFLEGIFKRKKD